MINLNNNKNFETKLDLTRILTKNKTMKIKINHLISIPGVFNSIAAKTPTKNGIKIRKNGIVLNIDILIKVIKKNPV